MRTPFDDVIARVKEEGFHNHRRQLHSNLVCLGIFADLLEKCDPLRNDFADKGIASWLNAKTPGARGRKIDLLVGAAAPNGRPDLHNLRVCVENKSVMTAHRNADARYDDLNDALQVLHRAK